MTTTLRLAFWGFLGVLFWIAPSATHAQAPTDLFFSEYIEGSSNNKAIEIYNGTGAAINLATEQYVVQIYFNGNTTATGNITLAGTIPAGGTYVIANSAAATSVTAVANQLTGSLSFNGDDAVTLRKGGPSGTLLDVIGQIGVDPGTEWGTGLTSTADNTIRRKAAFCTGDINPNNAFDPATEWDGFATDTFTGLGAHSTSCGTTGGELPTVSIAATDATGAEAGSDPIVFTITRTGSTTASLTVNYTIGGTATNGVDYTPTLTGTATIPVNAASVTLTLTVVDDAIVDANETVILTLSANAAYSLGTSVGNATITDNEVVASQRIRDIQGTAHTSPLLGQTVNNVPGIVTGLRSNGFYMQDATSDSDDRTSEGIFVFTSTAPNVAVGTSVNVSGTVAEFRSGGNTSNNLTVTQIQTPTILVVSTGNALPTPVVLGNGGRTIPNTIIEDQTGNVETGGLTFDPATDGIDFYESLEGMLVQINNPVAASPTTRTGGGAGEIWVLADNGANATIRSVRGGVIVSATDFNPERIQIDDALLNPASGTYLTPTVNVGAQLSTIVGVVNYVSENYEVLVTSAPTVISNNLAKETTTLAGTSTKLTVSTFNVENLSPNDSPTKFSNLAARIVSNLQAPDILLLEEIQDNNGATNDAVVDASTTFNQLIAAITAANGPTYQFRQINPVDDQDGGQPGGNIRVGFLFNPARVSFVDRPGGTSTAATTINTVGGKPQLSFNPGRVDPTNTAWTNDDGNGPNSNSRKPLAAEFVFNGQTVFVIGNHFNSKIPDEALFGVNQPANLLSEPQRRNQATVVRNFVQSILAVDANANVIVLGDINDFEFSAPVNILKGAPLNSTIETLPANERYTYNFEGNSQAIDHILVSNNLSSKLDGYDIVHINSEFTDPDSDHDPSVARFTILPSIVANLTGTTAICAGSTAALSVSITGGTSPYTVVYTDGQSNTTISNYTSNSPISVAPSQTTNYSLVSVTDANGVTSASLNGAVTVTANSATATITGSLTVCPGASTTLTAQGGTSYVWSTNASTPSIAVGAGTYSVTATAANQCTATATATVTTQAAPNAPTLVTQSGQTYPGGQSAVTVPQFSGTVTLVASGCTGTLTWTGPNSASGTSGTIDVPTNVLGTFVYTATCRSAGGCVSNPASATVTVTTAALQLITPLFNCATGVLTIRTTGGNGTPIEYQIPGQTRGWQSANTVQIVRSSTGDKLKIRARQRASNGRGYDDAELDFTLPNCGGAGRIGATEPGLDFQVKVLGNPIENHEVRIEVTGAEGQPINLLLSDLTGRTIGQTNVEQATATVRHTFRLPEQVNGILLLRVNTPTQSKTVKVVK